MSISILPEQAKIAELRAKTDRQLITLIDHQLDSGIRLAQLLSGEDSGTAASFGQARAETAWAESRRLLPKVYNLSERLRLEKKLAELRRVLAGLFFALPQRLLGLSQSR